jgi:hypothetical protein
MRTEEDGSPLVHRVVTDSDVRREAQLGLDDLLARGRAELSRDARERALKRLTDESDVVRERRMKAAQAAADRFKWNPIAAVVMFEQQTCQNCGVIHSLFRGFGTLYQQKASFVERWEKAECLDRGLPYQQRVLPSSVPCCVDCISEFVSDEVQPPYEFHPERKD